VVDVMRLLLVEDDRDVAEYVRKCLEEEGYTVKLCFDGGSGLKAAELTAFDLIVLDVMLPHMDGLEVTKRLRLEKIRTPILLLTGRDSPQDVVRGLDAGADDYLTKPFSFDVLLARIRARTRTSGIAKSTAIRYADLTLDTAKHEVWRGNRLLNLTRTEFSLLECLLRSAGRVATRDHIVNVVWGERGASDNNLDVFMQFLRRKVDPPGSKKLIHTERGLGYSLRDAG
jgi:two-component system response regulator MprA